MGWSEGKGLGAKENGIVEHVVARYKNDERGLGFDDRNDQWTKHEDDFNSLLANLSNGDNNDDKLHSGVSLEVKSKKSKARVHYHKFTRGKDLTRYSEKDLANIFGKKSLKKEENPKIEEEVQDDSESTEINTTEKVFTEKGSMEDYFKSKMAALKSKGSLNLTSNNTDYNDRADYSFKGFAGATNDEDNEEGQQDYNFQSFSFYNSDKNETVDDDNNVSESQEIAETKKKSKKKKKKHQDEESIQETVDNLENDKNVEDELEKPKKSKKKKQKTGFEESVQEEPVESKKSKKKKDVEKVEECIAEDYVPKKKKKRKNKDIDEYLLLFLCFLLLNIFTNFTHPNRQAKQLLSLLIAHNSKDVL
uniref:G-patch domain-containing protein n=1 Tax=Heliothis virescens TaxID=7102 RepID=A0A2A4K1L1_HELVI